MSDPMSNDSKLGTNYSPMHHPGAGVISSEPERNIIASPADADHVPPNRIHIVVGTAACTPDDIEGVLK